MEFKFFKLVCKIDFINNTQVIGNYYTNINERLEMKAIRKYKDAIWEMQGLINNSIALTDNFEIIGSVTLYGITENDDRVIMRHLDLNM